MKSKTATATATAIEIECPHCGELITDPITGSDFLTIDSFVTSHGTCQACGGAFTLPKKAKVFS